MRLRRKWKRERDPARLSDRRLMRYLHGLHVDGWRCWSDDPLVDALSEAKARGLVPGDIGIRQLGRYFTR